ncbi:E3 ubiquitin-protein ligase SIRP1 [Cardamine amara subsp. amara]|uniref:RING-type E3 ubiquitin transferase n=1 Tax=Cardamine amara subsp. amara TaxID=228776 RepID=A0ABD1B9Y8_CARAN
MVYYCYAHEEPESFVTVKPIYNDLHQNTNVFFDFQVNYTRAPAEDSDGEEEDYENLDTLRVDQTLEFDKEWLIGGDKDHIQAIVYHILELIEAPCYSDIVSMLTGDILQLKKHDAISALPNLERLEVAMDLVAYRFPGEGDDDDEDVILAVAPASDEAVENHLETVVVEKEGDCVICMDKIRVGSDVAACRMPCLHVFHRTCGEKWLRNSGVCPVCRYVFPS